MDNSVAGQLCNVYKPLLLRYVTGRYTYITARAVYMYIYHCLQWLSKHIKLLWLAVLVAN